MNIPLDRIDDGSITENLQPNLIVQTDANENLISSNTVSAMTIGTLTSTTINNSGTITSATINNSGTVSTGAANVTNTMTAKTVTATQNSNCNQLVLFPNDGNVGVIGSHITGTAIESAVQISVGGTGSGVGFLVDGNSNAQLMGDTFYKAGGTAFVNPSDQRLKDNITDFNQGLDIVEQIKVRSFVFKDDVKQKPRVGIIAQELQTVYPNAIFEGRTGYLHFDANDLTFLLINAVKDLKAIIDDQQKQINLLSRNSI